MARPHIMFSNWTGENVLTWAKETPNHTNLVIAGGVLNLEAFEETDFEQEDGRIAIPSGTVVGRTIAEAEAGVGFGPVAFTTEEAVDDDEVYLTYHPIYDARNDDEVTLYRHERVVAYNKLPSWGDLDPVVQDFIRANYQLIVAAE